MMFNVYTNRMVYYRRGKGEGGDRERTHLSVHTAVRSERMKQRIIKYSCQVHVRVVLFVCCFLSQVSRILLLLLFVCLFVAGVFCIRVYL